MDEYVASETWIFRGGRGDVAGKTWMVRGRAAATPRLPRGYSAGARRGGITTRRAGIEARPDRAQATGYCKAHGLIPDPEKLLDFKEWGTLAIISGGTGGGVTITNERACVLIANVHFLMVSLCAAFCPLPFQDTLLLEPGEPDEEPAGLVPAFDTGLTPAAELWNGRLAMLGLIVFASYSLIYQIPFLNAVDNALGGLLLAPQ